MEIKSISRDKNSLDECRGQVIENYNTSLAALGRPAKIRIVNAPG